MVSYETRDLYVYDIVWYYSFVDSYTGKAYMYVLPDADDIWFRACMHDRRNIGFRVFSKKTVYPFFI